MQPARSLRVLFMTPWYPTPDQPSRGTYVHECAKAASRVAEVTVIHMDTRLTRRLYQVDIDTSSNLPVCRARWGRPRLLPKSPFRALATFVAYWRVRRVFGRPDVIHAHVFSAGILAVLIGRITRTGVVITEHTTKFNQPRPPRAALIQARVAYRLAHRVLPVSRYLLSMLERQGLHGRFTVVPNVVDTALFHPSEAGPRDGVRLLFVGALRGANRKGLPTLLDACRLLLERGVNFHLNVIGDGPRRRDCEDIAARIGLSELVTFHGVVPKREVADAMREASLFVSPSSGETFCCPLAEAQASGLPSVATDVGASAETLSAEAGFLVPPADPPALAEAIHSALEDPTRWNPERIASHAQRFAPEPVSATLERVYLEALAKR